MRQVMITVVGKDRPGIIARVTGILYRQGANLEDISMTILEGEFAMMMIASLRTRAAGPVLKRELEALDKKSGLTVFWKDLRRVLKRGEKHRPATQTYMIRVTGPDRTGLVHETSRMLARDRLNITDLNCKILGRGPRAVYAMLLEVDVPRRFSRTKIERSLARLAKRLKVEAAVQPFEPLSL